MLQKIHALLDKKTDKALEQKVNRRKLLIGTFGIALSIIGLNTKDLQESKNNKQQGYGSGSYGG